VSEWSILGTGTASSSALLCGAASRCKIEKYLSCPVLSCPPCEGLEGRHHLRFYFLLPLMIFPDTATSTAAACLPIPKPRHRGPTALDHWLSGLIHPSLTMSNPSPLLAHQSYSSPSSRGGLYVQVRQPMMRRLPGKRFPISRVADSVQPYIPYCPPTSCSTQVSSTNGRHGSCRSKIAQVGSTPTNYAMRYEAVDEKRRAASEPAWRWHWMALALALALACCISSVNCKSWRMSDCSFLLLAR